MPPTNGLIHLAFIKSAVSNANEVSLYLSPFYGDKSGTELATKLSTTNLIFDGPHSIASSVMTTAPVLLPENYVGTLVLSGTDITPILWRITLTKAAGLQIPGSLMVTPAKISCLVEREPFGLWGTRHIVNTVTLRNTNNLWALEGIAVIPGEIIGETDPEFSIAKNVEFFLNGVSVSNLMQTPPPDPAQAALRTLPANGQIELGLGFNGLKPGDHTFELSFATSNSRDDLAQQKLTVNVKVSDSVWPAAAVLIISMFLSFFAYKWLKLYKNRVGLEQRAKELRDQLPPLSAIFQVVWVRMFLRQADFLASRLLLTDPSFISGRLDQVEPVLDAMNEAKKVQDALKSQPELVKTRFSFVVDDIYGRMRSGRMKKDAADAAKAEFVQLGKDIAAGDNNRYWNEVSKAIKLFKSTYDSTQLPAGATTKAAQAIAKLDAAAPTTLNDMMDREAAFARLSLLYERRGDEELVKKLAAAFDGPLDVYFRLADDEAWKKIKHAEKVNHLVIRTPFAENKEVGQAYEPIEFSVTTGDATLDKTYLFTHLIHYEWTFKLKPRWRPWTSSLLEPKTDTPSVTQFATKAGNWIVSVKMVRATPMGRFEVQIPATKKLRVGKSSEVRFFGNLERAERWSLAMAGAFALVSGLLTFYYKNPTFGSMQDYLALFLWGVGVDQTKNFLQTIQTTSQDAKPTPKQTPAAG
jgi:hypothetical protein